MSMVWIFGGFHYIDTSLMKHGVDLKPRSFPPRLQRPIGIGYVGPAKILFRNFSKTSAGMMLRLNKSSGSR